MPLGYEVPDETFHREFMRDTVAGAGQAIVLTGPPGRGKSTYLSALCEELADLDIPTVRHHYFLSTTERGRDRVHSYVVGQSIEAQVKRFHPDVHAPGSDLRGLLEACAAHYKTRGKPFVLVLDGLDHVWRINGADKRPLDDVFSQVIPCPDNMVLLVGTQPVDDAQLPRDLLAVAPNPLAGLPSMSESAVLSYLHKAVDEGRLSTRFDNEEQSGANCWRPRPRFAGRPTATRCTSSMPPLSSSTPGRPGQLGYRALTRGHDQGGKVLLCVAMGRTAAQSQDTLRLVCVFPFFWPKAAFSEIAAKLGTALPDVGKVEHLLHSSAAADGLPREFGSLCTCNRWLRGACHGVDARSGELAGNLSAVFSARQLALDGPGKTG